MEEPQNLTNPDVTTTDTSPAVYNTAPPSQLPPSTAHRIFFGRFGLRAGWGIAIFVAVCFLVTIFSAVAAVAASGQLKEIIAAKMQAKTHPNLPPAHFTMHFVPVLVIVNDGVNFLGMLAMCWLFSKGERRHLGYYGIGKSRFRDFFPGAFWGFAMLSVLIGALYTSHVLVFDSRALHGAAILGYGLKWLLAFLLVGFSEEYQLRGYLQFTLTRGMFGVGEKISPSHARTVAFWIAAVIMSLLFGALHTGNNGENLIGLGQVVLVGLVFSYVLWRTGSLWWAIGFHMAWDWAQSFFYGVPDSGNVSVGRLFVTHPAGKPLLSGGPDGPEGSILCVPVMLLVFVIVRFTTRPGEQPPLEQLPTPAGIDPAPPQPAIATVQAG